jgi:hypothetical protein
MPVPSASFGATIGTGERVSDGLFAIHKLRMSFLFFIMHHAVFFQRSLKHKYDDVTAKIIYVWKIRTKATSYTICIHILLVHFEP